jgi:hypothetical protein
MKVAAAVIAVLCTGALIKAASPPSTSPALVRVNGRLLRPRGTCEFKDLLRFELKRGRLIVDASPTSAVQKMVVGHSVVLSVEQSPDPWIVVAHPVVSADTASSRWMLRAMAQRQAEDKRPLGPININAMPGTFALVGEGWQGGRFVRVEFLISGEQVRLTIANRAAGEKPPQLSTAQNLAEMLATHPLEMRRYVSPLLDAIAGYHVLRPGPGDIYRAFDSIDADPTSRAALETILPELVAPDGARREFASAKLQKLGAPGVLAALRIDRDNLSPEQKSRLERFIAANTIGFDPQTARRDRYFLADCLSDNDRRVRVAARDALAALLGSPVDFDVDQDAASHLAASARIIEQLPAPATQPH